MNTSIILLSAFISFSSCLGNNKTSHNTIKNQNPKKITTIETPKEEPREDINTVDSSFIQQQKEEEKKELVTNGNTQTKHNKETTTIETVKSPFNHSLWNDLLQKHVSVQGNVNYKGFKLDYSDLERYLQSLSDNIPNKSWSKAEKLSYWINAYNAYTIKLIIDKYPLKSIKDINRPWDQRFIKLGEKIYTLNDIEHEILRKMNEPRIHFAIVCASISCPKLQNEAFTPLKSRNTIN